MSEIYGINLAGANVFLIKGAEGYLLIDAGPPGTAGLFQKRLHELGIDWRDIKLIVITHVHYDHVGNLAFIKEKSNSPILVHQQETDLLETAKSVTPPATRLLGRIISFAGNHLPTVKQNFTPVKPEIVISNDFSLQDYGVLGSVLETPGHTNGSISVVLQDGAALVGDLTFNLTSRLFPLFAENTEAVYSSWKKLIDSGVRKIYPGHGKWPFEGEKLVREYQKHEKRNYI